MEDCMSLFGMVCLAREKCENFQKQRGLKGRCWIYFTFIHLCGFRVPRPFKGFLFQFYNLIGLV